jgi:hypothetical protein
VLQGIGIVTLAVAAVAGQYLTARVVPWVAASMGSLALAGGMALIVAAAAADSVTAYIAGSVLGGAGFGAAFLGGLRALVGTIPPAHRASVMSAFYVVAYASLSIPAVLAGFVVTRIGIEPTFELFGAVVGALAVLVAVEAWRSRWGAPPIAS